MSRRVSPREENRRRKLRTSAWIVAVALVTIALLYEEQIALLYLLATAGVTALLVVVARADLSGARRATTDQADTAARPTNRS